MHAFMHVRGHGAARVANHPPPHRHHHHRRPRPLAPALPRATPDSNNNNPSSTASTTQQRPQQSDADADAARRRLLAVRRPPDLHGRAGDLASRLAGAGPGGLPSAGAGLMAPTLLQQTRQEDAQEAADARRKRRAAELDAEEATEREREAAKEGDFGLPPGADVAEVEADESARDPRAVLDALALLAGARHHTPPNRRMLVPLLRYAGPRLLDGGVPGGQEGSDGGHPLLASASASAASSSSAQAALARPPEPLSSVELVDLAHAMARIGPGAAPTRQFLAQVLLALRARGFWEQREQEREEKQNDKDESESGDEEAAIARLSWALPQLAAWADDEGPAPKAGAGPSPDERALWHLLIGRTLADEEGLPWLEREQRRRRRERAAGGGGAAQSAAAGADERLLLPSGCVLSLHLAACERLVRRRGRGATPAHELANMLVLPVSLAQQLEAAAGRAEAERAAAAAAAAAVAANTNEPRAAAATTANNDPPPAAAFYSAAADAVRAAAGALSRAVVDALEAEPAAPSSSSSSPLPLSSPSPPLPLLTVPYETAALLGALAALGARPRAGWVRGAAAAALEEDFMLPLYGLGELADVSRALLAFATASGDGEGNGAAAGPAISARERRAWAAALREAVVAAGAAAAAQAAQDADRRADLDASRVQRAARVALEALEA